MQIPGISVIRLQAIGYMSRCLLKARVEDAEILVRRHVEGGQNVIAGPSCIYCSGLQT
jgi:hypothetical protein